MGPSLWDPLYGTPLWDPLYGGNPSMGPPLWDPLYVRLLGLLGLGLLGYETPSMGYGTPSM